MSYLIISAGGLFWSNSLGWTEFATADRFTLNERMTLNLPMGGDWIKIGDAKRLAAC